MNKKIGSLSRPDDLRRQAEEIIRGKTPQLSENLDNLSFKEQRQLFYELRVHEIELEMQNESLRQTKEELESSRVRYFNLYNLSPVGYFTLIREELILEANLTAGSLLGVARNTLVKKSLTQFILREDQDIYYHHHRQLFKTGAPQVCELRLVKKNGSLFWAQLESTIAQESENGDALCYTMISDITQRKQVEKNLIEAKEYLENLIKYANAPIIVWDTSLSITRFNRAFENLSGYNENEVIGKKIDILLSKDKNENLLKCIQKISSGEIWETAEIEIQRKDGKSRTVLWNAANILDSEKKKVIATIAQGQDITTRKKIEVSLKKSKEELSLSYKKLQKAMKSTIQTIALILEKRDPYTSGHQERVTKLACAIAKEINLSPDKIERLYMAGILHDIGKINIPTEILSKPGRLSEIEFNLIRTHPQIGKDILEKMELPWEVSSIVLQHHERMDGSGYPAGLSGEDILPEARILAVADVVEAMASHRPYRPALGVDKALEEIIQNKGKLYDSQVVDVCVKLFKQKGFKLE